MNGRRAAQPYAGCTSAVRRKLYKDIEFPDNGRLAVAVFPEMGA
jgi:hypothetical protein